MMKNLQAAIAALAAATGLALLAACTAPAPAMPGGEWTANPPNPSAPYPPESRTNNEQGTVLLRVRTSPQGVPLAVEVKESSGFARLDRSAVETVWKWKFKPTPDDGSVVWREVPVRFLIRPV
ncbi:energy transducer TonB [Variovorax sp. OV329]|uniref:energy transducer TonB n=1 Tax=Variovorax sp. OV329 TaxID=1882825 RepID=UPI0008E5801A|nr:energy transducer TonB [Variovorax sp. OV329]SFM18447.1 TonB family C-terminal domain-containing protein [Variovorax sp. OV329]